MNAVARRPLVSVVIPTFRADAGLFERAVRSILEQSLTDLELIIVEDPSDLTMEKVVAGFADARIRYILNGARSSLAEQHNAGLALARADLVARFDSDDISHPRRLELQHAYFSRHPEVDVLGGAIRVIDENDAVLGCRHYPTSHEAIMRAIRRYSPIANPTLMFRRGVFEALGGWDTSRRLPAGDYEWFSRIAKAGSRFANLSEIIVDYRLHSGSLKSARTPETVRATIEVKQKYWPSRPWSVDGLVLLSERILLRVPPPLVNRMFRAVRLRRCHVPS